MKKEIMEPGCEGALQFGDITPLCAGSQPCSNCGRQLAPGQIFCPDCGKRVRLQKPPMPGKKKKTVTLAAVGAAVAVLLIFMLYLLPRHISPGIHLDKAADAFAAGDYALAVEHYQASGCHSSEENVAAYTYALAMTQLEAQQYLEAAVNFQKTDSYLDAQEQIYGCGMALLEKEAFSPAAVCFGMLSTEQAREKLAYCQQMLAQSEQQKT